MNPVTPRALIPVRYPNRAIILLAATTIILSSWLFCLRVRSAQAKAGALRPRLSNLLTSGANVALPPQSDLAAPAWVVDRVTHVQPIPPDCGPGVLVTGLAFDSQNRPAVSWQENNGCNLKAALFWARKDAGIWNRNHITPYNGTGYYSGHRGLSSLAMGPGDNPFLIYDDVAYSVNDGDPGMATLLANLGVNPLGPGGVIELLGDGRFTCTYNPRFDVQFAPGESNPRWATALSCPGYPAQLKLNGTSVVDYKNISGFDYAVGPHGENHLIYSSSGPVFYNRGALNSDLQIATINRFSGDVQIAADAGNKLHAIIRGYNSQADYDLGLMGYITSTDGVSWTDPVYIDTTRTASNPSLALDKDGNPAVAYWRFGEIRFSRLQNGQWTNDHVITVANGDDKMLQLTFDKNNVPTIAFYDPCAGNIYLATPGSDAQAPVDLTLDVSHSPDPAPVGNPVTYTIRVVNNGNREATHVVVTDTLPPGVNLISTSPAPFAQTGNTLSFDMGLVTPASNCAVITVKVMTTSPGLVTNSVTVTSNEPDANPGDNTITQGTDVRPSSCFPPRQGMVSWWTGDGNANDIQGSNNGTLRGGVTFAQGKVGQAFNLNGVDAYIETADNPGLDPHDSFSINAWVSTSVNNSQQQTIASKYECGGNCPSGIANSYYGIYVADGKLNGAVRDSSGAMTTLTGSKLIADGNFHNVTMVRDIQANELLLYVDGALDASASLANGATGSLGNDDGSYDPLLIGGQMLTGQSTAGSLFSGLIDEVTYYNRALSASEAQAIFNAPQCTTNHPPSVTNPGDQTNAQGATVSLQIVASDPDGDKLTYSATGLPPGLGIDPSTGLITGTLGYTASTYSVTVSVSDGSLSDSKTFNWIVTKLSPAFSNLSSPTITYGAPSTTLSGVISAGSVIPPGNVSITINGVTQSVPIQSDGSFSSSFAPAGLTVSGSPYSISYGYAGDANFNSASDSRTLTVIKATPTVTWNNPADIVYGTALSATQLNATASVPGTFVYTPNAGAVLNAGPGQTLSLSFTPNDTGNYNSASKNVQINVLKATPAVNVTGGTFTYDGNPHPATGSIVGVNGANLGAPTFSYNGSSAAPVNAGTYAVVGSFAGDSNYNPASNNSASIIINKATPVINWSNPADIVYGTPLGNTQLNAVGSIPGTLVYTPAAGAVLNAGNGQTLSVSLTPADTTNYNDASKQVVLNVLKATPVINWKNPADITYGTPLGGTQLNATANVAGSFAYTPAAGTVLNAGSGQALSNSFTPTDTTNYTNATASVQINVLRATPTVNVTGGTFTYDGNPHPASGSVVGINGEDLGTPALSYNGSSSVPINAGTYAVVGAFAGNTNYNPATGSATIIINKAPATISLSNLTQTYDGSPKSVIAATAPAGLSGVSITYNGSTAPPVNAGSYAVVASLTNQNYLAPNVTATLTILPRPTSITYTGDTLMASGGVATLSGVLKDTATSAPLANRTMTLTLGTGPGAQSCSAITDTVGKAACVVGGVSQPLGPGNVSAAFAGDNNYLPSSAAASTLIFAYPAGGGNFVIGDLNAQVGTSVTFWGAQWWKLNSLSGGVAPASFKGFVDQSSTTPPVCGSTWATDPGNSSHPPSGIPSYMAVIVSSSITKSGPTIAGDIAKMVIVQTDAGYGPNPGHAGTGKIVAIICH